MLFDKQSHTKYNNKSTYCCSSRLEAILGLEKWREGVGGRNKDDVAIK
jgi:hypothetical protein